MARKWLYMYIYIYSVHLRGSSPFVFLGVGLLATYVEGLQSGRHLQTVGNGMAPKEQTHGVNASARM